MKKKFILSIATIFCIGCILIQANKNSKKQQISNLTLTNIEALADEESSDGEKKYRYQTWSNEECWIYVGGAYAKGKKVSCYPGNEHPICVDCSL